MYKLYQYKALKLGFVILCPTNDTGHLKSTISSITEHYPKASIVTAFPDETHSNLTKTVKGGKTIVSLLNFGLHASSCKEWNFIVLTGGWIKSNLDIKYSYFINDSKDILYPITRRALTFHESEISGLLLNKKTFLEIGDFPEEDFEVSRLLWTESAIKNGCHFKGIVGAKIF